MGKELGVSEIIIPPYPGYFSAWGMLATNPKADFAITSLLRSDKNNIDEINSIFNQLKDDAKKYFSTNSDIEKNKINFEQRIDMRYFGQEHTVTILLNNEKNLDEIIKKFNEEHKKAYTFSLDNTAIEFVTFRLTGYSFSPKPEIKELSNNNNINDAFLEKRKVNYGEEGEFSSNVYIRDKLPKNVEIIGPSVIEEDSTVTVVLPGQKLNVDEFGFLRIR